MKRVSFHTLGCRLNQAETALAADDLIRHGYQHVSWGEEADVLVINSCAVTGVASQKSRQVVRAARRKFPNAFIVLMGCDALVDKSSWEEGGPDLVVPHPCTKTLSSLLPQNPIHFPQTNILQPCEEKDGFTIEGTARFSERTRANIKVQDGCDFFCTYCIVPYSRGPSRSRSLKDIIREAEELLDFGYRELVLCGVNITTYNDNGMDLADLLRVLSSLGDGFRIRLGSSEPGPAISRVIELMEEEPKICRFLHLPMQYGEDTVLKSMGRHYNSSEYASLVRNAARRIPGICIGADVIVGFPGETDETFDICRKLIEDLPLSLIHVFPYSPRPGTVAAEYKDRPSPALAAKRAEILLELAELKARNFAKSQIGQTLDVLIEDENPPGGWTDNYLHANFSSDSHLLNNNLVKAKIISADAKREIRASIL